MYQLARQMASNAGLEQYEISNFARADSRCRHNLAYWKRLPYLGLGPSAASSLWSRRTLKVQSLPDYVKLLRRLCSVVSSIEVMSPDLQQKERVWLGLRTSYGVPADWIWPGAATLINRMRAEGLLADQPEDRLCLTRNGMAVADEVTRRLLLTITN